MNHRPISSPPCFAGEAQLKKIKRNIVLSSVMSMMDTTGSDGKTYKMGRRFTTPHLTPYLFKDRHNVPTPITASMTRFQKGS